MRWTAAAPILLSLCIALSGCLAGDDAPSDGDETTSTPTPTPTATGTTTTGAVVPTPTPTEDTPLPPFHFAATGCASLTWQHVEDFSVINHLLAPGFVAADVADLMKVDGTPDVGKGAYGPVTLVCADNNVTHSPLSLVFPGVLVQPPRLESIELEPAWIDGYEAVVGTDDPFIADLFASYAWTVERDVTVTIQVDLDQGLPNPGDVSRVPEVRSMTATGTHNGTTLFEAQGAGTVRYHTFDPDGGADAIRFWIDTPSGLSYIDARVNEHGTTGTAYCNYPDATWSDRFDRPRCDTGQTLSILLNSFDLEATLVHLPGVHA